MSIKNQARTIGSQSISTIGLGLMGLSLESYGAAPQQPDEEKFTLLDAALARGCTHWDTADVYGNSEELIGKWFKRTGKRDDIFLATKFGFRRKDLTICADAESAQAAVTESLKKLGTNIDLLYLHRVDANTPIEITIGAMAEFVKSGHVKYLGISECSSNSLRRAHAVHPISAIQVEYSPFCLDTEQIGLFKTARELGVTIVAYSPLGRGLLTGKYNSPDDFGAGDFRRGLPKFSHKNFPKILQLVSRFKAVGEKHNATSGQIAIAWVLAQGNDIVVIPGTTKIKYLEENLGAVDVVLSMEEITELRKSAEECKVPGDRYAGVMLAQLYVDSPPLV